MRKILSVLMPLLVVAAAAYLATAQTPVVITAAAPTGQVAPGGTVTIPLSMTTPGSTAGVQFSLQIPPELSVLTLQPGTAATAAGKSVQCGTSNPMICVMSGINANAIASGNLANILATVSPSSAATSTTINFSGQLAATLAGDSQGVAAISAATFPIAQIASLTVTSLTCTPASLLSNGTSTCTVLLSGHPTTSTSVTLSSSNSTLSVPASVTVPAQNQATTFTATAGTITTAGSAIVTAALNGSSQTMTVSLVSPTVSRCDVNGDGKTDSADVAAAQSQVTGLTACSSADLNGDGKCTVVDLQNLINAALGQACRTAF